MKRRDFTPCLICKEPMNNSDLLFYKIHLQTFGFNLDAVRRQAGLDMMTGSVDIATILGPDEHLATEIYKHEGLLCCECALEIGLIDVAGKIDKAQPSDTG